MLYVSIENLMLLNLSICIMCIVQTALHLGLDDAIATLAQSDFMLESQLIDI